MLCAHVLCKLCVLCVACVCVLCVLLCVVLRCVVVCVIVLLRSLFVGVVVAFSARVLRVACCGVCVCV